MKAVFPILAWLLWLPLAGSTVLQSNWEAALVLFAAWVLIPGGLAVLRVPLSRFYWLVVVLLGISYALPDAPLLWRGLAALPYAGFAVWLALRESTQLLTLSRIQLPDMVRVAAPAFWAVGAVFSLCFLAGFQPLGFDPLIVSLTAAHFHVAGFVLTAIVYAMLVAAPGRCTRLAGWASLAGMPAVAVGIVLTHWGYPPVFEWLAALLFVCFTALVVGWHLSKIADKTYPSAVRRYWLFGTVCLLAGISLASLYALRFIYPLAWINIPNMKTWHGTLNTLGFAWLTLRGWAVSEMRGER